MAEHTVSLLREFNSQVDMTITEEGVEPVRQEGKVKAVIVCWILGFGSAIAWNSMLTVGDYYYQVFPDYHPSRVLTIVYQPFALGTMAILVYYEAKINTNRRNLFGYIIFFLSTLMLIVIDLATSGNGGIGAYIGICGCVACFGFADALVQGGMTGDLAFMCPEFMQSFFAGFAAAGAVTAGLRLVTRAALENSDHGLRKGAMLFISISAFLEFLCIFLYAFVFPTLPIVKYYRSKAASEGSKTVSSDLKAAGILKHGDQDDGASDRLTNKQLIVQNYDYVAQMFLTYVLTLSIYPGFLYENTGRHSLGSWYPLVLIATFNMGDYISRYIPLIEMLKLKSRKGLSVAVLARILLVPAFYFTAKYGSQGCMIFLVSFLGLTNGYLTVCILTEAPKGYKGPEQNALGNLLVLSLLGGITIGVSLDWLWMIGNGSF